MKREELTALGINEKNINEIMALNGRDIEKHKQTVKQQEELAASLLAQLEAANEQLLDYEPNWKQQVCNANENAKTQIEDIRLNATLDKALINAGVRDDIAVKAHLNLQKFKEIGEPLVADELADELSKLKSTHAFLFCDAPEFSVLSSTPGAQKTIGKTTDEANNAIRAYFSR